MKRCVLPSILFLMRLCVAFVNAFERQCRAGFWNTWKNLICFNWFLLFVCQQIFGVEICQIMDHLIVLWDLCGIWPQPFGLFALLGLNHTSRTRIQGIFWNACLFSFASTVTCRLPNLFQFLSNTHLAPSFSSPVRSAVGIDRKFYRRSSRDVLRCCFLHSFSTSDHLLQSFPQKFR